MKDYTKTPNYYLFEINGVKFDVNDLLEALSNKIGDKCSHIQFNYYSNSIEYILRSWLKENTLSDLKKARSELDFLINSIEDNNDKRRGTI